MQLYLENTKLILLSFIGGSFKMNSDNKERKVVTITEAAELHDVTRQAIYVAIKLKKLKATKKTSRWMIDVEDLETYRRERYSRLKSTFNGELLFDNGKGFYSINQVARLLKVPAQKIYYATRVGQMKAQRKGVAWVIHSTDVDSYKQKLEDKATEKRNLKEKKLCN